MILCATWHSVIQVKLTMGTWFTRASRVLAVRAGYFESCTTRIYLLLYYFFSLNPSYWSTKMRPFEAHFFLLEENSRSSLLNRLTCIFRIYSHSNGSIELTSSSFVSLCSSRSVLNKSSLILRFDLPFNSFFSFSFYSSSPWLYCPVMLSWSDVLAAVLRAFSGD